MRGEQDAEQLLVDHGYEILDRQLSNTFTLWCDGEAVTFDLRADLLVSKDEIEYIAEVKTGESAPSLRNAATRRQLLEYTVAYDCPVILLVDVEGQSIQEVCFVPDES